MQTSEVFPIYYVWIPGVTTPESQWLLKNKVSLSLVQIIHPGLAGGPSLHSCFALEIVLTLSFPRPKLTSNFIWVRNTILAHAWERDQADIFTTNSNGFHTNG